MSYLQEVAVYAILWLGLPWMPGIIGAGPVKSSDPTLVF